MRLWRFAFGSLIALGVLLGLALVVLWTADLGVLKPQIEQLVTRLTGRTLSIDGELSIDLGGTTRILAREIHFANPDWLETPDMVAVRAAEVHIDLWSLLDGPILLSYVDVDGIDVSLGKHADGRGNWVLDLPQRPSETAPPKRGQLLPFRLGRVEIDEGRLRYSTPERTAPLDVRIASLRKDTLEDGQLQVAASGSVNARQVALSGRLGPQQAILAGDPFDFALEATLDTFTFTANGTMDDLAQPRRPTFAFTAEGPDVNDLTRMFGLADVEEGPIDLSGSLRSQQDGPLLLSVQGNAGRIKVASNGTFSDLANLQQVDFDLLASGPDLSRVFTIAGIEGVRTTPFMVKIDATRNGAVLQIDEGDLVFGDAKLELAARLPRFPALDDGRIHVAAQGPDAAHFREVLGIPGVAEGPFSLNLDYGVIDGGSDRLDMQIDLPVGQVVASGALGDAPDYVGSTFDGEIELKSLHMIGTSIGLANLPDAGATVRGSIELEAGGLRTSGPLTVATEGLRAEITGRVAFTEGLSGTVARGTVQADDVAAVASWFDVTDSVPSLPAAIDIDASLRAGAIELSALQGTVGRSEITAAGVLSLAPGLSGTLLELSASGPALEELVAGVDAVNLRPGRYALSGEVGLLDGTLDLDDIRLVRENGAVQADVELDLPFERRRMDFTVEAKGLDARSIVNAVNDFQLNQLPFQVTAKGGLRGNLLSIQDLDLGLGNATLAARGDVNLLGQDGRDAVFSVEGSLPSLAALGTLGGLALSDLPLTWSANVETTANDVVVDDLVVKLGKSDINGQITFAPGARPRLDVRVTSDSLVAVPLVTEPEDDDYDPEPVYDDGRLIPDIAIPFDRLAALDAHVEVAIGHFERQRLELNDVVLRADLVEGALELSRLGFNARAGRLDARASLQPDEGRGRLMLQLTAREFALGLSPANDDLATTGDIGIDLTSVGTDLRALAANANGTVLVDANGGRLGRSPILRMLYGDLLEEVVNVINPFRQEQTDMGLECVVVPLRIADGKLTTEGNVFVRTDKLNLSAQPSVDLATERLRVVLRTTPRRGLTISAAELLNPYVEVVGTLARPQLAVDKQGALISGGAAVASGGVTILARAFLDRLTRSQDPCTAALETAITALGDPFPVFEDDGLARAGGAATQTAPQP